jgi:hypothetical protein
MRFALAVVGALLASSVASAQTPHTFGMTFEEFRRTLDENIRKDTLSHVPKDSFTTKACSRKANHYDCTFNEAGFQRAVNEWRKMGLILGKSRIPFRQRLSADTVGTEVSRITVTSVRDDMIHLLVGQISTVVAVMRIFDPGAAEGDDELQTTVKRLGLMRGDVDPTIGKPMSMNIAGATVTCTNWDTQVTPKVECVFTPR